MPKTKRRKKARSRSINASATVQEQSRTTRSGPSTRRGTAPNLQNAVFSLMVMLGFLGLAIFFTFFYGEDANHYLYGALAGVTALGWVVIAVRRWSAYSQRARA